MIDRQLNHDNIVKFIGVSKKYTDNDSSLPFTEFCLLTELCTNGDLSDYMKKTPKPNLPRLLSIMYDIAFGCAYLHGRRPVIVHRDLKSLNVLVSSDGRAKIADFGLAKLKKKKAKACMKTVVGTTNWQAPEVRTF